MAKATEPVRPVIVKKIIQGGHGGHHGGAWKVAYADFVTAMMAFFLLMWLLGATTEKQRKALADYFAPTLVTQKTDSAGGSGLFGGDSIVSADKYPKAAGQTGTRTLTIPRDAKGGPKEATGPGGEQKRFNKLQAELAESMKKDPALRRFLRNIRFTETQEGLRIDMVDEADFTMFAMGTDQLTPDAAALLRRVAEVIAETPNGLIIRGHTDATPYVRQSGMNNWQLSTARAETTRLFLMRSGLLPDRINRLEGVADREPYIPGDPLDSRNRRMSITLGRQYPAPDVKNADSQSKE